MSDRYIGKIYRNKNVSGFLYFKNCTIGGVLSIIFAFFFPYIMKDERITTCYGLLFVMFFIAGLLLGVLHTILDIPLYKSQIAVVIVFLVVSLFFYKFCGL